MQKATNIFEFVNNFVPANFLTENEAQFRVPLYEDLLAEIRDDVLYTNHEKMTVFVKGQKGTGKTTALNFLPNEDIRKKFHVINMISSDYLDLMDVHISHFLIQLCFRLIEEDKTDVLKNEFEKQLKRLKGIYEKRFTEEIEREKERSVEGQFETEFGLKVELPKLFKFFSFFDFSGETQLSSNIKANSNYRKIVKEAFETRPEDLFELANKILDKLKEIISTSDESKEILLVINELDHMRDISMIQDFFVTNKYYLTNLKCKKIVSMPLYLQLETGFGSEKVHTFCLKTNRNPLPEASNSASNLEQVSKNRTSFYKIVEERANANLYSAEVIEKAIEKSGGVVRQFIEILYEAASRARRNRAANVSVSDVEEGIHRLRQLMEEKLAVGKRITVLDYVREKHTPINKDDDTFIECLLSNMILYYQNQPNWYSTNPLIEDTVRIYASKLPASKD
jgi:hypothetical protein